MHDKTIGDAAAIGLCGSGLVDAVAELAVHGVIESSGRFTKNRGRLPQGLQAHFATQRRQAGLPADRNRVSLARRHTAGAARQRRGARGHRHSLAAKRPVCGRRGQRADRGLLRLSSDGEEPHRYGLFPPSSTARSPMSATPREQAPNAPDKRAEPGGAARECKPSTPSNSPTTKFPEDLRRGARFPGARSRTH